MAKHALVEAAYRNEVARLCDTSGDVTLDEWMDRFAEYAATKRGVKAAPKSAVGATWHISVEEQARRVLLDGLQA